MDLVEGAEVMLNVKFKAGFGDEIEPGSQAAARLNASTMPSTTCSTST